MYTKNIKDIIQNYLKPVQFTPLGIFIDNFTIVNYNYII